MVSTRQWKFLGATNLRPLYSHFLLFHSHERKKKYWEQLEQRCRHLYRRNPGAALGSHFPTPNSQALNASGILVTPGSQCGYCTSEDPRYYNLHSHHPLNPTEVYPPGLWGAASTRSTSEAEGCYWNPQRSNGNIYSPNPEEAGRNENQDGQENQESRYALYVHF